MPITSDIPKSEIVSSVRPISFMTVMAIASDVGIETQTTIALRHERRKKTIAMPVKQNRHIKVLVDDFDLLIGELRLDVDDVKLISGKLPLDLRKRVQNGVRCVDFAGGRRLLHVQEIAPVVR